MARPSSSPHGGTPARRLRRFLAFLGSLCLTIGACQRNPPPVASHEAPAIPVSHPVQRQVTDFVDFTGRTEAVQAVSIRPRVTGYLVKMPFKEGAMVKSGDLLFEIDPRPYQAQLDEAKGQANLYKAQLQLAKTTLGRSLALNSMVSNSVSQQELDQERAAVEEADARVKAYEKNVEVYRLNHEFTQVVSPIDGQVSRYYLTLGNLVNQDQTLLTTVVSVDPMYVYFDVDEPTLLRVRRAINEGRVKRRQQGVDVPVYMGLQGEEGYPHEGTIDFSNNQVNPATGSLLIRAVFPNPEPAGGIRLLSPGMFVRVRLPIGPAHPAVLVIDRAVGSDQGLKYVYVLDSSNKVQYRRVKTRALQEDGLRVIEEGVKPDDRVVVGGLQQVRPQMEIRPEQRTMPTLGQATEAEKSKAEPAKAEPSKAEPPAKPAPPATPPKP